MEAVHKYMIMDGKTYKPAMCPENGQEAELFEERKDTVTMVIRTDNYIIEIEIGQE